MDPDTQERVTKSAILSVGRKNGKTALIAALVLVHLCGPEAQINAEIVSAANDRDQAAIVFKYVKQIVELSPRLTDICKVIESTKRVTYEGRGNFYQALSAEAGTKHGLNPAVVIYDELAQAKNIELFDVLETSQGAQHEPLFFTIGTQSHDPQHPLSQMIDDALTDQDKTVVVHIYEVPEDVADIFDEECWYGANPALGDFRNLDELRKYAARAKRLPSKENVLRNLYLNQRVTMEATLFSRSVWMDCKGDAALIPGEDIYLALDYAHTTDLCALAAVSDDGCRMQVFFWKPEDLLEEHGTRDRKDYLTWYREGLLEPCPGKTINPDSVAMKVAGLHEEFRVVGMAYDRWRVDQVIKALDRQGIQAEEDENAALPIVGWGQGYKDMAPAIDAFEAAVITGELTHDGHQILTWNIANAIVTMDPAGNRKLDKAKSRLRIDGAVAGAMAVGLRHRHREESKDSIYRTMRLQTA